jgi:hypothetical protein
LRIAPDDVSTVTYIGGAQFEVVYNESAVTDHLVEPRIVPLSHDPSINIIQHIKDNGDGTKSVIAMITNPEGFAPIASWSPGQSILADLQFTLVVGSTDGVEPTSWNTNFWLNNGNSYFIDLDGDTIANTTPTLYWWLD